MANKVDPIINKHNERQGYIFHCPACGHSHVFYTVRQRLNGPLWHFNGNMERPTFRPSLLVNKDLSNKSVPRCHIFVTGGRIQYLNDCTHEFAGKTIEMEDCDG